ncbi:LysR family transcriptional regulator [Cellvibrio sp. PSBB023]|jgi:DNA-binding transcriptional LysR family regulator|uniref:LysR family transcriptional regulator n=1 Tax=Cellvibrio sp. PSBB023 TaxID=1945512 RepID=UPI00098ED03E|nr:LysR family transcriptional regulator [Cellvibrio sp. PSBB023]AQT60316.1 LysR family transcriptional regulator [Cellvibrio sp. PSBB023]
MNIRHLTFRLLQVYVAVVRSGSISQAAQQLHLTQPTVSLQVKRLSEAVGEPLLELREGSYKPTFVGTELYHAALDALTRFEDFDGFLTDAARGNKGHFSIGVVTTAQYVLPRLLSPYAQQYPAVDVTFNIGNRGSVLQRFENQLDDLYLFSHPPTGDHVISRRFLRNPLVLIAPIHHWAAQRDEVDCVELVDERFLMREPGSATRMVFENFLREQNLQLHNTMQIESNEVIRMSVENGLGLAVLSEHTLAQSQARVAQIKVRNFPLNSHWYLVQHGDRRLPVTAHNFIEFMNAHLTEWVEEKYIRNELAVLLGNQ